MLVSCNGGHRNPPAESTQLGVKAGFHRAISLSQFIMGPTRKDKQPSESNTRADTTKVSVLKCHEKDSGGPICRSGSMKVAWCHIDRTRDQLSVHCVFAHPFLLRPRPPLATVSNHQSRGSSPRASDKAAEDAQRGQTGAGVSLAARSQNGSMTYCMCVCM